MELTARGLTRYLIVAGIVMAVLFALMMGIGAIVRRSNVGLWQRAYTLTLFSTIGIAGYAMLRFRRSQIG